MTQLPTLPAYPEHMMQRGASPDLFKAEVLDLIGDAIANHPRSLQKRIGPSEVGHECPRRIAYILLGYDPLNPFADVPWLPTIGTAVHAWLEEKFTDANHGATHGDLARWLVEMRVCVGQILGVDITGSCDLYDRVTATVLDWKIIGTTQLKKYRSKGPGQQYRCQIHMYGKGIKARGLPVDRVIIAFLPRNGELSDAHFYVEDYREDVADWALQRANGIAYAAKAAGPAVLHQLEPVEAFCKRCPFYLPKSTDPTVGCPGVPQQIRPPAPDALTLTGA